MASFKKLNTKNYQKSGAAVTEDNIYWKQFGTPVLVKEFGPIDYIDFSPIEPYHFAVTCSVRVQVYNPITKLMVKNYSRFRENAYGATFRHDGKLLCTGGEEAAVKLFDVSSRSLLRLFEGHTAAVHRTYFLHDKPQIASFSDDKQVKIWDIPEQKAVVTYQEHTDYIRAGAVCLALPDIILSGGYDNLVHMYDVRTENKVLTVDHGCQIESLLFLPSGGIFLSAGGTCIKVWDSLAGGKLLGCISQHHKTITCLRLASNNKRLLSGGLDRHVKVYDLNNFKVVHTLDYPNAVLSLGVSKNDDTLVAGLVDGLVSISRREDDQKPKKPEKKTPYKFVSFTHPKTVDEIIPEPQKELEAKYDICLRKFQYSKALDCVLLPYIANKNPQVTVSLIQELMRRQALDRAFKGRDTKFVLQILRFFLRNITDCRFSRVLISAFNIFLDVYEDSLHLMPVEVGRLFMNIEKLIEKELELADELGGLEGAIHLLMAAASVEDSSAGDGSKSHNLVPTEEAKRNLVVNLT